MPLTENQKKDAAHYNRSGASAYGWIYWYPVVAKVIGANKRSPPGPKAFANLIAKWQRNNRDEDGRRLAVDGKMGPTTFAAIKAELGHDVAYPIGVYEYPPPPWMRHRFDSSPKIKPVEGWGEMPPDAPWFRVAKQEEWWWSSVFALYEEDVDWDEKYFQCSPLWGGVTHSLGDIWHGSRNHYEWCAAFVNYCLHRAGYSHTGSAGASSFLTRRYWDFEALSAPRRGCVVVVDNDPNGNGDHVAFLDSFRNLPENPGGNVGTVRIWGNRQYTYLGGNQGGRPGDRTNDTVKTLPNRRALIATTDKNGVTSPYLWPLRGDPAGNAKCNISLVVETAHEHYCYPGHNPKY